MRLLQFIKWWWDNNDEFTRTAVCFGLLWAIPCGIATIWFGEAAVIAAFAGILTVMGGWGLYGIFRILRGLWDQFNDENPSEEIAIIRKLKGTPAPSGKSNRHEYY